MSTRRKIAVLLSAVLVVGTLWTKTTPKQVFAVGGIGEPCCDSGFTYSSGTCVNSTAQNTCNTMSAALCPALSLVPGMLVPPGCSQIVSLACQSLTTANSWATQSLPTICGVMGGSLGITMSIAAESACEGVISLYSGMLSNAKMTQPLLCSSLLQCNSATATCQSASSGATAPTFSPTCKGGTGIDTALGCIPTDPQAFINAILPWAVGIGGGIGFLLMLYAILLIILSAGNPEKMQAGRELFVSAISGILIIVFSVFLLRVVGVDILGLF